MRSWQRHAQAWEWGGYGVETTKPERAGRFIRVCISLRDRPRARAIALLSAEGPRGGIDARFERRDA